MRRRWLVSTQRDKGSKGQRKQTKSSLKLFFDPLTLCPFVLKLLSKTFRDAKYYAAFDPLPVPSSRCDSKTIVPHHGIRCSEEFPACSDHDEFLQFRLESSSTKALKS